MRIHYHHERTVQMPFDQYLKESYFSNSRMGEIDRGYPLVQTDKMRIGKEVDMILAGDNKSTGMSKKARKIADRIQSSPAWQIVKDSIKQPSVFGKFVLSTEEQQAGWCPSCENERTIVTGGAHCANELCEEFMLVYKTQPRRTPAFEAPFKTRPDYLCRKCTVDLKVTEVRLKYIPDLITQLKYERQMWIHRTMCQVPESYLMIHSVPDKKTVLKKITTCYEDEIINFVILNGSDI